MNMKKLLAMVLALALVLTMTVSFAEGAEADWTLEDYAAKANLQYALAGDYTGKTVILHSNDVHGQIDGYAYIAGLRDYFVGLGADVILTDSGDFSQGSIYVSSTKGAAAVEMMNAAQYDLVTLGNHEFDYGYEQLMENLKGAKAYESFQFVRQGFFCVDSKDATADHPVFNRIVSLKSSFKLPGA